MTFIQYDPKLKKNFFDRRAVLNAMDEKSAKTLKWFGFNVRRKTRSYIGAPNVEGSRRSNGKITKRRKPRTPPRPPIARTSDEVMSLRNIQFAAKDAGGNKYGSVAIFGIVFGNKAGSKPAPDLHEKGGTAKAKAKMVTVRTKTGRAAKSGGRTKKQFIYSRKFPMATFSIPARPYLKPSFDKILQRLNAKMKDGK